MVVDRHRLRRRAPERTQVGHLTVLVQEGMLNTFIKKILEWRYIRVSDNRTVVVDALGNRAQAVQRTDTLESSGVKNRGVAALGRETDDLIPIVNDQGAHLVVGNVPGSLPLMGVMWPLL